MTNVAMVVLVFCIGFGWGVAVMAMFYWRDLKRVLKITGDSIELNRKLLESEDQTRKKLSYFADLTYRTLTAAIDENQRLVEGLKKLVDTVKEEEEREGFQRDNE